MVKSSLSVGDDHDRRVARRTLLIEAVPSTDRPAAYISAAVAGFDSRYLSMSPQGFQIFRSFSQHSNMDLPSAAGDSRRSMPAQMRIPNSGFMSVAARRRVPIAASSLPRFNLIVPPKFQNPRIRALGPPRSIAAPWHQPTKRRMLLGLRNVGGQAKCGGWLGIPW